MVYINLKQRRFNFTGFLSFLSSHLTNNNNNNWEFILHSFHVEMINCALEFGNVGFWTLVFLSVWIPYVLFTFLESHLSSKFYEEAVLRARGVCEALFFANSFVNPILYKIRIPEFRRARINLISWGRSSTVGQMASWSPETVLWEETNNLDWTLWQVWAVNSGRELHCNCKL